MSDVIEKIKQHQLLGKGGASFPTAAKWQLVKQTTAKRKYIICNGAEGEPGVFKDHYILERYPELVITGIQHALQTIDQSTAYLYLRVDYKKKFYKTLNNLIGDLPIKLFAEPGGYLAGEETAVCEVIAGQRAEAKDKPPYPGQSGLWNYPTLINNVETFYDVAKIMQGTYQQERCYSISGDVSKPGVYELPNNWSIKQVLTASHNLPTQACFAQVGGGASGEIILDSEFDKKVSGAGAVIVHQLAKTDYFALMQTWLDFFFAEKCDHCTPCREGVYRLHQMIQQRQLDKQVLEDLWFVLERTSFCAFGRSVVVPLRGLITKLQLYENYS